MIKYLLFITFLTLSLILKAQIDPISCQFPDTLPTYQLPLVNYDASYSWDIPEGKKYYPLPHGREIPDSTQEWFIHSLNNGIYLFYDDFIQGDVFDGIFISAKRDSIWYQWKIPIQTMTRQIEIEQLDSARHPQLVKIGYLEHHYATRNERGDFIEEVWDMSQARKLASWTISESGYASWVTLKEDFSEGYTHSFKRNVHYNNDTLYFESDSIKNIKFKTHLNGNKEGQEIKEDHSSKCDGAKYYYDNGIFIKLD